MKKDKQEGTSEPKKVPIPLKKYEEQLSRKESVYVEEYLRSGGVHTTAAIRAGYSKTQSWQAMRWIVKEVIRMRWQEFSAKDRISTERVLGEYASIAFANLEDFMDESGNFLPVKELPTHLSAVIKDYEVQTGPEGEQKIKVVLHSKMDALGRLVKLMDMEPPSRTELTGKDGGPVEVQLSRKEKIEELKRFIEAEMGSDGVYEVR